MPKPDTVYGRNVTGKTRVRKNWLQQLILQIEVEETDRFKARDNPTKWIDANPHDLFALDWSIKSRGLINLFDPRNS